jgi:DNA-binding Xre family transcriptional regulator
MKELINFIFGSAKSIKVEEIEILCNIFKCNIEDLMQYKEK